MIVAISLLGIVAASLVPLLIATVKATTVAKMNTQARNLAQARVESMRNLPFHVDAQNGSYVDLLDRFYRNLSTTSSTVTNDVCTSRVYVPVGGTSTAGEPAKPFYRCTIATISGFSLFSQVVAVQFLGASAGNNSGTSQAPPTVVTPASTYDSQATAPADAPASNLVGVTLLTKWRTGTTDHVDKLYTQISADGAAAQTIDLQARATAFRITGTAPASGANRQVSLTGPSVTLDGARYSGSTANAVATGALAESETLGRLAGAQRAVAAPPGATAGGTSAAGASLDSGCTYACFANSSVSNVGASVASGLPAAGTSGAPVTAQLVNSGGVTAYGFEFTSGPDSATRTRLLIPSGAMVRTVASNNSSAAATASGYIGATSFSPQTVTAALNTSTGTFAVFPTSFAPAGVLQVSLTSGAVSCGVTVSGSTGTATPTASASYVIQYLPQGASAYVDLPTGANLSTIAVGPTGSALKLSDYISSVSRNVAVTSSESNGRVAKAKYTAALQVTTQGVREVSAGVPDPDAQINVELGIMSCSAEDNR
ncbi:MAG: hypothetical protein JJD92_11275 [Frankiaceae bacterium]|nr:hypothetical protein [Frankiaceae bacterium]